MLKYFKGRSIGYVLRFLAVSPLALIFWIIIEITNIFRPVFIVGLSYKGRITHYLFPMEQYLRNANQLNKKYTMIFVMPATTPNEAVRTVYRRYSIIIDSHFPNFIRRTFSILAELLKSRFTPELPGWQDLWQLEPATTLTDDELKFGDELRQKLGIPKEAQYVCLGVREANYYASITTDMDYGQNLSTWAKSSRNVDINNYMQAATHLANLGIYVVRMGSIVGAPLPIDRHPMIIDYATTARSELGDIVLGAHCKFCISGAAGIWVFSICRNKALMTGDVYGISLQWELLLGKFHLFTTRLLKQTKNRTLVPFSQMPGGGLGMIQDAELAELGLEPIANTPDEILNATIEMNDWIDGKLHLSDHDEELQTKFYNCYPPETRLAKNPQVRISPSFLRKYQDLL
jgi:putative glycosyltransferase (TIGR04372 family)